MSTYERWSVAIGLATVAISIVGFLLVAIQLKVLREQVRLGDAVVERDHEQRRKEATFTFALATRANFYELRESGLPSVNDPKDVERFLEAIPNWHDSDDPNNILIMRYLGAWETVATGINLGAYERDVIDRLNGPEVVRLCRTFGPWIEARRERTGQANLYREIELVASSISNR